MSLLVLVIYTIFGREINHIAADTAIPIVLRVLFMGGIFQFGIALSTLCCVPNLLYNLFAGNVHTWLPFSAVQTTAEAIESGFQENALAMLLTALFWGFFEGFNYVVIFDKIGERYPSKTGCGIGALSSAQSCVF